MNLLQIHYAFLKRGRVYIMVLLLEKVATMVVAGGILEEGGRFFKSDHREKENI